MSTKRFLTIFFTDGSKLSVTFPQQGGDPHQIVSRVQKALDANQLSIEIEGELYVVPMSSIKYLQLSPSPEKMPEIVIRGGVLKSDY